MRRTTASPPRAALRARTARPTPCRSPVARALTVARVGDDRSKVQSPTSAVGHQRGPAPRVPAAIGAFLTVANNRARATGSHALRVSMARRPCNAIAEVHLNTSNHFPWVLRVAIACPGAIDRIALLGRVRRHTGDGRAVALRLDSRWSPRYVLLRLDRGLDGPISGLVRLVDVVGWGVGVCPAGRQHECGHQGYRGRSGRSSGQAHRSPSSISSRDVVQDATPTVGPHRSATWT